MIPLPLGQVGDIELLIRARHGLIVLDAADPERAAVLFEYVSDRMRLPHSVWRDGLGLTQATLDDGVLDRDVFESVRHAKRAVIERTGVLEYFPSDERLDEVPEGFDAAP